MFGKGISREGDVLDLAADANIVEKSGSGMHTKGAKIGQGRENAKNYLLQNPLICEGDRKPGERAPRTGSTARCPG